MNDKNIRYLAWGIGIAIALCFFLLNDRSFQRYGFFASEINDTMMYDFFRHLCKAFGVAYRDSKLFAYILWFIGLGGGVYLSWKLRFKTGKILGRFIKKVHEKA